MVIHKRSSEKQVFYRSVLFLILFVPSVISAQSSVQLSSTSIPVNQNITVTITLQNMDGEPVLRSDELKLINKGTSTQIQIINGAVQRTIVHTYVLRPEKTGTAQLTVEAPDKTHGPFEIRVDDAQQSPPPVATQSPGRAQDPFESFFGASEPENFSPDEILIRNIPSRTQCRRNEIIVLDTVIFYRQANFNIRGMVRGDVMEGFGSEEAEHPKDRRQATIGGQVYTAQIVRRRLIWPIIAKQLTIRGGAVRVQKSGGFFFGGAQADISIPDTEINVSDFPEPRPQEFSGAVGSYAITVQALTNHVRAHEPCLVTVTISGNGNLKTLIPPELPVRDAELSVNRTGVKHNYTVEGTNFSGSIVAEYYISSPRKGIISIPSVEFSFFNPKTRRIETVTSKPIRITVKAPDEPARTEPGSAGPSVDMQLYTQDIRFLKPVIITRTPFIHNRKFIFMSYSICIMLMLAGIIGRHYREKKPENAAYTLNTAKKNIRKLSRIKNDRLFLKMLESTLHHFITENLNAPFGTTLSEVVEMSRTQPKAILYNNIISLIRTCQKKQYAPDTEPVNHKMMLLQASNLIEQFQKEKA